MSLNKEFNMNIKQNRALSMLVVVAIYILAIAVGVGVYLVLPLDNWLRLLVADVVSTVITFVFSVLFKNASVYDPYWSVQPIVILVAFSIFNKLNALKIVVLIVVCIWGVRLTANWAYTFYGFDYQDWRYTMLKQKTGKMYPLINFLGIHMVPTLIVYACVLPAVFVIEKLDTYSVWSFVAIAISLFAIILQGVADIQMHKFRKNKNGQTFIRVGLWKHSRHPNYLGEILMWWGVGFSFVISMWNMWYLLCGAVLNTLLFLFVSIPMADKRQARKEGFDEYKKQTRMLLPIKVLKNNNIS